jgi:hypothetical protein
MAPDGTREFIGRKGVVDGRGDLVVVGDRVDALEPSPPIVVVKVSGATALEEPAGVRGRPSP